MVFESETEYKMTRPKSERSLSLSHSLFLLAVMNGRTSTRWDPHLKKNNHYLLG